MKRRSFCSAVGTVCLALMGCSTKEESPKVVKPVAMEEWGDFKWEFSLVKNGQLERYQCSAMLGEEGGWFIHVRKGDYWMYLAVKGKTKKEIRANAEEIIKWFLQDKEV